MGACLSPSLDWELSRYTMGTVFLISMQCLTQRGGAVNWGYYLYELAGRGSSPGPSHCPVQQKEQPPLLPPLLQQGF